MTYYYTNKVKEKLGNNIKRVRKRLKKKQVEIGVEAGVNPSYYGKIERGLVNPSIEKVYRIIKALKVESSDVLPF